MSRFFFIHSCLGLLSIAVVVLWQGFDLNWLGFTYGVGIFSVNIGLLILLVKWLFGIMERPQAAVGEDSEKRGQLRKFLVMGALLVVKFGFVGATVYFGLVVWNLPSLYFVGGGLFGLLTTAVVGAKIQKRIISRVDSTG